MRELTEEDFKRAVKNPYFEKLCRKVEVPLRHEVYDFYKKIGDMNGVEPEIIMNRCLVDYVRILSEDD